MMFRVLADVVVFLHFAFVLFSVAGGLLCFKRRGWAFVHLPSAAWSVVVEAAGWTCPLTPLENRLRRMGGGTIYSSDFIEHYVMPVLYPERLTRPVQLLLGLVVLLVNVAVYLSVFRFRRVKSR